MSNLPDIWQKHGHPPYTGNWLVYRPSAPKEARVVSLWYDQYHNGWSGAYVVVAWRPLPKPPSYITKEDLRRAKEN